MEIRVFGVAAVGVGKRQVANVGLFLGAQHCIARVDHLNSAESVKRELKYKR